MSLEQARLLIGVKRWDEAREALSRPLADPAAGGEAWCLLAQLELASGQKVAAQSAAERAVSIEPNQPWAIRLLAITQQSLGRLPEAENTARRGIALDPDSPEMAHTLVMILLARRRFTEAETLAAQNLQLNAGYALAWESAAHVSLRRARWQECEERARAALALSPQDADVMMVLGVALQARGRRTEAGELYAAVSRIDPAGNRGREALGELGLRVSVSRFPNGLRYLLLLLPQAWLGLLLGMALQSFRQWRARAGLEPHLRAVVRRQQRAAAGTRLFVFGLIFLVLSVLWFVVRQPIPAIGAGSAGALLLMLWRQWAPHQSRRWWAAIKKTFQ